MKRLHVFEMCEGEWVCANTGEEAIEIYCEFYNAPTSWYKELENEGVVTLRDYLEPMQDEELKSLNFTGFDGSKISWYGLLQFTAEPRWWACRE